MTSNGDISFTVPGDTSFSSDPLDLADFEDEAALINDLLAGSEDLPTGLGIGSNNNDKATIDTAAAAAAPLSLLELDVKLARLLGVLEHACQDTSSQVERAIEEVSRSVPRLTFDLQLMRENVVLLRFTLDSIRKRSNEATSAAETSSVMRRLKVLDTVKNRMEASRDVLREAEAWSSLESEVTALVQEQAYVKAAERLAEANKSMVVFQNSPEYEQRRNLMVSLQNGLEAGLSASLVAAINARDMAACKNYYAIFGQIQRENEFRNYYFGSRRANLVKGWENAKLSDGDAVSTTTSATSAHPVPFSSYLPTFYTSLQETLDNERTYIPAIFPDPLDTLSTFLTTTLDALSPSLPQQISDLSNSHGPRLLLELIKIYHSTEEFAVSVDRIFGKLQVATQIVQPPAALPSPSTPGGALSQVQTPGSSSNAGALKRVRRQSKAMSISRRHSRGGLSAFSTSSSSQSNSGANATSPGGSPMLPSTSDDGGFLSSLHEVTAEPIRAWETALFEPFLDWQAEYADLETRLLKSELGRVTNGQDAMAFLLGASSSSTTSAANNGREEDDEDDDDGGGPVQASANRAKGAAKILLEQTSAVFGLAEEALGRCMALTHGYGAAGYVEAVDGTFRTFLLKERDTLIRAKDSRSRRRRANLSNNNSGIIAGNGGDGDLNNLEYSQEDWATFQLALRLLETCRTIWDKIGQLESRVRSRLVDVARLVKDARTDPLGQMVPGTTRGALALLWQSTLNSATLNTLLDSVDAQVSSQSSSSAPLFSNARSATIDLTRASQLFLHDTILAPLMQILDTYASLSIWTQSSESRPDSRGAFDLHIPTFSLSPSETITRIGESLFNLPGMFEVYAEDDALGFSLETLPDLDAETVKNLRKEHGNPYSPLPSPHAHIGSRHGSKMSLAGNEFLPPGTTVDSPSGPPRISPTTSHHPSNSLLTHTQQPQVHQPSNTSSSQPLSAEIVISTWLSSLTRSVLLHLTNNVLPSIRSLSKIGQDQLASDLGYISNVAKAMDVEVEQVEKWRVALESEGQQQSHSQSKEGEDTELVVQPVEIDSDVLETLKRMRSRLTHSALPR